MYASVWYNNFKRLQVRIDAYFIVGSIAYMLLRADILSNSSWLLLLGNVVIIFSKKS